MIILKKHDFGVTHTLPPFHKIGFYYNSKAFLKGAFIAMCVFAHVNTDIDPVSRTSVYVVNK